MKRAMVSIVTSIAFGGMLTVGAAELKRRSRSRFRAQGLMRTWRRDVCLRGRSPAYQGHRAEPHRGAGRSDQGGRQVCDANGKVLGTATASTKRPVLNPNDTADVNLEFLTVTGPLIKQVKNQTLEVVAVSPKP